MSNYTSLVGGSFTTNGTYQNPSNFAICEYDFTPTNSGGLAKDSLGNIYIADTANHTIRRITDLYTSTTFAGLAGSPGSTDGTGAAARFNNPKGLATDSSNNLFVSDTGNGVIRKITSAGVVTTHPGSSGTGLATDSSDNLYIAVTSLHIIQKVTSAGVVTTLAGLSGSSGNTDGTGSAARFNSPTGVATDSSGNIYVTESSTTIRKITSAGVVTTLAGTAGQIDSVDGLGADARFVQPIGITVDSNDNIFVSDFGSNRPGGQIRRITPAGLVTSIAGARGSIGGPAISSVDGRGTAGTFGDISARLGLLAIDSNKLFFSQGPTTAQPGSYLRYVRPESNLILSPFVGTSGSGGSADAIGPNARFSQPNQTAFDANGNTYVADYANYTIRKVTPAGVVTTLAGTAGQSGSTDGTGAAARFNFPSGIVVALDGNIYVADQANYTIRKITPFGVVTTLAGTAGQIGNTDGTGSAARFNFPVNMTVGQTYFSSGVAVNDLYVTSGSNFRKITYGGVVTTPPGTLADAPWGIAINKETGDTYVSLNAANIIQKITSAGVVTTLAGTSGSPGSTDGTGSAARFKTPKGISIDDFGNIYVADSGNFTIRKITPAGVVTTLFGVASVSAPASKSGVGSVARLAASTHVSVDNTGSIYLSEDSSIKRTLLSFGFLAGSTTSSGATDGPGPLARFASLYAGAFDSAGNLYVSDGQNYTIRKITSAGVVTTLAGLAGQPGSADGSPNPATFSGPFGVTVDSAGNVFVGDSSNNTIRKITSAAVVTTFAGTAGSPGSTDGTGSAARFFDARGVAVDSAGNVFVADSSNATIRKITSAGVVTTLAGTAGQIGSADGTGAAARFLYPSGVAVDSAGNIYVADQGNHTIRKVTSAGVVTTFAGTAGSPGSNDGTGSAASFNTPFGVAVDSAGNVFVGDSVNNTIRKITSAGVVTTFAGTVGPPGSTDGTGSAARFYTPSGVAVDSAGNVFVADQNNNTIRKITSAGVVTTFAGQSLSPGRVDGGGVSARFFSPCFVAADSAGNVFVGDTANNTIRKITSAGFVTTLAGYPVVPGSADGTGTVARFNNVTGLVMAPDGNLYAVDQSNATIRKITSAGVVTTLAGTAGQFGSTDGTGAAARFNTIVRLAVDSSGNLYTADSINNTIRKITSAGVVTTLAGTAGTSGYVDGTGAAARFDNPNAITIDSSGNLYVNDALNYVVRKITSAGVVTTFLGTQPLPGRRDGTGANARSMGNFYSLDTDAADNIYPSSSSLTKLISPSAELSTIAGTEFSSYFLPIIGNFSGYEPGPGNIISSIAVPNGPNGTMAMLAGQFVVTSAGSSLIPQTITFAALPSVAANSGSFVVSPVASSGLTVTLTSSNPAVASVNGFTITPLTAGSVTITATQAGDGTIYAAATPVPQPFTVTLAPQTITFAALPTTAISSGPFVVSPTASSGLTVTLTSSNPAVVSVNGFTLTPLSIGSASITATQAGNGTFAAATPVPQPITIVSTPQTITFAVLPPVTITSGPFVVSPTASSGLTVTLTSSNPAVASVNGFTITPLTTGSTTITATQAGNGTFAAATPVPQPLSVSLVPQTISFGSLASVLPSTPPFVVSPSASSGLIVTLTSSNPAVASVSGFTITPLAVGSTTITATQAGNGTFAAASPVLQPLSVSNPAGCNDVPGCDCECDTLVIGEAGPQGPQGLLGINGTNGSNGLNAFTTLSASFVQPNEAPAAGNTATILVGNSAWIALGQNIYISQAGYYQVTGIVSSTSIAVSLLSYEILSPGSTVPSGRKISPSSQAVYIDPVVTSLDINQGSSAINPVLRARGSNTLPLLQVDAILNKVGINVSPVAGGKTLTVGGSLEVTGDSTTVSGFVSAARLRVGSSSPAAELNKLLFFSQNVTVTLSGSIGAAQRVSATCTGAALGDIVSVGYTADPVGTFENDVSVSAVVSAANTVNVFFQNYSTTSYSGAIIGLKIIVSTYIAAV